VQRINTATYTTCINTTCIKDKQLNILIYRYGMPFGHI